MHFHFFRKSWKKELLKFRDWQQKGRRRTEKPEESKNINQKQR
jgi:hypothetical protein